MHKRYIDKEIAALWSSAAIYRRWQEVELAVIEYRDKAGMPERAFDDIVTCLQVPVDEDWLEEEEARTKHDLNAFLAERRRYLPEHLRKIFHEGMTSYDTEEPARAMILTDSATHVCGLVKKVLKALRLKGLEHKLTPMLGHTHGQWAGIMSFGVRCAKWFFVLQENLANLEHAMKAATYAKLSGAIGTYSEVITPEVEARVLPRLGLKPFYGATQTIPRTVWLPLAQALQVIVETMGNIAETLRLGARSENHITQEPFSKGQKGSSAMPHKRNPITLEKVMGMVAMARGYVSILSGVATTWEERDIRESAAERNAWPDLFHTTAHALTCMERVLKNLMVNKADMLRHIQNSRGTYATDPAKGWLAEQLAACGMPNPDEVAYRVLQAASFKVFDVPESVAAIINSHPASLQSMNEQFAKYLAAEHVKPDNIQQVISEARVPESEHYSARDVNTRLELLFRNADRAMKWEDFFRLSTYIRKEEFLIERLDRSNTFD